jgi:hypothetical protein
MNNLGISESDFSRQQHGDPSAHSCGSAQLG